MQLHSSSYDVLVFDCYGTLVDWQTAITRYWQSVITKHDAHVTDEFLLDFHAEWEPREQQAGGLYQHVLKRVMQRLGERLAFTPSPDELDGFVASVAQSPPFDDTHAALQVLKQHFHLAIVSNTDRDILIETLKPLGVDFDYLITAEDTGAYKPNEQMMNKAMSLIGEEKRKLHVAQSLYHDIQPANKLGNHSVWINRQSLAGAEVWQVEAKPDWTFTDLQSFAEVVTSS